MSNLPGRQASGNRVCRRAASFFVSARILEPSLTKPLGPASVGTHNVEDNTDKDDDTLDVIVPQSGLLVKLAVWEHGGGVEDGSKGRKAGRHKAAGPEKAESGSLQPGVYHDESRRKSQCSDL